MNRHQMKKLKINFYLTSNWNDIFPRWFLSIWFILRLSLFIYNWISDFSLSLSLSLSLFKSNGDAIIGDVATWHPSRPARARARVGWRHTGWWRHRTLWPYHDSARTPHRYWLSLPFQRMAGIIPSILHKNPCLHGSHHSRNLPESPSEIFPESFQNFPAFSRLESSKIF